jgi:hypothetical protein
LGIFRTYLVLELVYVQLLFDDKRAQVVAVVPDVEELVPEEVPLYLLEFLHFLDIAGLYSLNLTTTNTTR